MPLLGVAQKLFRPRPNNIWACFGVGPQDANQGTPKEKTHLDTFDRLGLHTNPEPAQMLFSSAENRFWGCPGLHSQGKTILPKCYFPMQAKGPKVSK